MRKFKFFWQTTQEKHECDWNYFLQVSNSVSDGESLSPERDREGGGGKVARMIGGLPIAEYEGSPRRYGLRRDPPVLPSAHSLLASPSVYAPRPGFPQVTLTVSFVCLCMP